MQRWVVLWRQKGGIDGDVARIQWSHGANSEPPHLFKTKKECSDFIRSRYGYIAKRKDLRAWPHGWRIPKPVKVEVKLIEV